MREPLRRSCLGFGHVFDAVDQVRPADYHLFDDGLRLAVERAVAWFAWRALPDLNAARPGKLMTEGEVEAAIRATKFI